MINEVLGAPEEGFTVEGMEVAAFTRLVDHSQFLVLQCQDNRPVDEQSVLGWDGRGLRQGERCGKGGYQDHLPSGG